MICVCVQGLQRKNPNSCFLWTTLAKLVSYQKKNLPGCSGLVFPFFLRVHHIYSVCFMGHFQPFDELQVFHRNFQRCSFKESGRGRHQGHDAGRGLWWQGENLMGGLSFSAAGSREGAAVCSAQCQRLEKVLFKSILIFLTLSDAVVCLTCAQGWRNRGRRSWVETRECPSFVRQTGEKTGCHNSFTSKMFVILKTKIRDYFFLLSSLYFYDVQYCFAFFQQSQDRRTRDTQTEKVWFL